MTLISYLIISACLLATLGLVINRSHLLSALLCLELLLISSFAGITLLVNSVATFTFISTPLILLTLSACEASAGLALLVSISRTHGSDLIHTFNLLQC